MSTVLYSFLFVRTKIVCYTKIIIMVEVSSNMEKKSSKKLMIPLIGISIIMILLGIYINYIHSPKRIIKQAANELLNIINYYSFHNEENIKIKDNYKIESKIKTSFETDDKENQTLVFFKNLNDLEANISFEQDLVNQQMLFTLNSNNSNEEVIKHKFLVKNSTQYYYNYDENVYINNGGSNYFEALSTEDENFNYIVEKVIFLLSDLLKEENIIRSKESINQNNKNTKSEVITIRLNNEDLKQLITEVLNNLKEDKKAYKIITGVYPDFEYCNESKEISFIDKDDILVFKIYTNSITGSLKKYYLSIEGSTPSYEVIYEYGNNQNIGYIVKDTRLLYKMVFSKNTNDKKIVIYDSFDKEIGTGIFTQKRLGHDIVFSLVSDKFTLSFEISKDFSNINLPKSYHLDINTKLRILKENKLLINYIMKIQSEISANPVIQEDTSNSLLMSCLSEEQKHRLKLNLIQTLQESR